MARPLPAAFMSTGLISKRNRNMDSPSVGEPGGYAMPDTPSKRVSFPPMTNAPFLPSAVKPSNNPKHEFGTPSTPFSSHAAVKVSPESFGKGVSIFGTRLGKNELARRSSFISIDGDENLNSPSGQAESQSSNDEMPPTPTKPNGVRSKENSLRSSLFGRRTSLGPDTFVPPAKGDSPVSKHVRKTTPIHQIAPLEKTSPHTPQESFAPPDPSGLSISAHHNRPEFVSFSTSTRSNAAFPPATPTAPRDGFSFGNAPPLVGVTRNDVDTSLTARFHTVHQLGVGEFSQVFKVENPISSVSTSAVGSVWAVKKAKKPFIGAKDRERKRREVRVLEALRGHDHIIGFTD
ncbi:hypothetical protein LTS18_014053, partial [Coniosporium uncinatum]